MPENGKSDDKRHGPDASCSREVVNSANPNFRNHRTCVIPENMGTRARRLSYDYHIVGGSPFSIYISGY